MTPLNAVPVPESVPTQRLLLRRPRAGDGAALHGAIHASLAELKPWMAWASDPLDEDGYEEHLRRASARFEEREELRYLIFGRERGDFIGSTGFHAIDWRVPKAEIGYWVDSRRTGHGFITEAVAALTALGFEQLGFRRIEIRCDAMNTRSIAVPRRLGYQLDARLVHDDVAANDPACLRDTLLFSLTRWPSGPAQRRKRIENG